MSAFAELDETPYALPDGLEPRLPSPALVVYLDRVRENVRRVLAMMDGDADRWRPHVKTTKMPRVFAELVRAGVRSFKCATTREADYLLRVLDEEGVTGGDVLVAYPLVGPALARLARLAAARAASRISVLCEDPAAVGALPPGLGIFVDINSGMNRTGLDAERDDAVIADVARRAGDRFRGVHFYEGHLHGFEPAVRRRRAAVLYEQLVALVDRLHRAGIRVGEVVTSGTPTFRDALASPALRELAAERHRVSPGTVVFHDARSEEGITDLDLVPAALLFTRVVSHPGPDLVTCDAGSKSIAAEAGDPCAHVLGRPDLEALRPTEEHLPLRAAQGERPPRGTTLLLVPRHVCPTVNLAERALLIDPGRAPTIVAVSARAHDLILEPE